MPKRLIYVNNFPIWNMLKHKMKERQSAPILIVVEKLHIGEFLDIEFL